MSKILSLLQYVPKKYEPIIDDVTIVIKRIDEDIDTCNRLKRIFGFLLDNHGNDIKALVDKNPMLGIIYNAISPGVKNA